MKHLLIAALVCLALCGCRPATRPATRPEAADLRELENAGTNQPLTMDDWKRQFDEGDTNTWLSHMEIWACDDGTFEVKNKYSLHSKVQTLEEAKAERYAWADEMVNAYRAGKLDIQTPVIPDCGKRVVP